MAGSYRHITTNKGKLRAPGRNFLDNMGDANEALEELYGMVWWLANRLAGEQESNASVVWTDKDHAKATADLVEAARNNYQEGLAESPGVQKAGPGKADPLGGLPFHYTPPGFLNGGPYAPGTK